YTVTATVTDNYGLSSTATSTVTVVAPQALSAKLAVTPTSGLAPLAVSASVAGSTDPNTGGTIISSINFGDGTVATGITATHTYSAAGTYTVTATVTDNYGLSSTATSTVTVVAPQALSAKLAVTPTSGLAPLAVSATTAGSSDPNTGGTIISSINFGDGTTMNAASGSHTYTTAGTYTVTATVTDNYGLSSTATSTVTVVAPQALSAKLAVTPTSGLAPLAVSATTAGSSDPNTGGTIISSINFGDGTTMNAASGSHTYTT